MKTSYFPLDRMIFLKGRSTPDLLLLLSQSWHSALEVGLPSLVIALDIAGAFDFVFHRGLLATLDQLVVVRVLLHLFSICLRDRSLRAAVNG